MRNERASVQANDDRLIRRGIPERLAAVDGWQVQEVVGRRRRCGSPLERASVPRIRAGELTGAQISVSVQQAG